jgi:hypothetical protein
MNHLLIAITFGLFEYRKYSQRGVPVRLDIKLGMLNNKIDNSYQAATARRVCQAQ